MFNSRFYLGLLITGCLGLPLIAGPSLAQTSGSDDYAGKNISLILGYPPGGANDVFARLVTRHFGRFIPGGPRLILQHMPGAGSATAANYMFNVAPRDGSVLALLVPTLPVEERMGASQVKFKSKEFTWIGRLATAPNVTFIWHTSKVRTYGDALKVESTLGQGAKFTVTFPQAAPGAAADRLEKDEQDQHLELS